ncbi:MAG: probable membrane protein yetF [uncultured Nocardioides sp.]|uniref:Probable membrane protein yetF n=1 Tax=uncultured Nocardioides sp. TaxID=198441 RepID=A0A6J4N3A3_9ACTN|nr:MAG: probable membrane protein yetF [uncultured Nocardioides sp.]
MDILIRALVIFTFLWLVVRIGGKREVAQLSAFDMILLVTVGDLVAQGVVQEDYSLTAAVIAVATFTLAGIVLNAVAFRYPRFRPWLAGRARVVVRDGEPLLETLAGERMTIADLNEAARQQGIRRLRDIELAVLETDGAFSFFTVDSRDDDDQRGTPRGGGPA